MSSAAEVADVNRVTDVAEATGPTAAAAAPAVEPVRTHTVPVSESLRPFVRALMSAELAVDGPLPMSIVPHESMVLSVQLGRSTDPVEQKGEHGTNTRFTGIRHWTGDFAGQGDCVTLFALLTPLGAVRLLEARPLAQAPRIRARVADMLDRQLTRRLESDVARADTLDDKLRALAAWLETRAMANRRVGMAALRAGRAAMRVIDDPRVGIERLADEQHVSRRQLERDFNQWLGTSPRHLAQVARVQSVSRKAQAGAALADIAADVGFADQAHMSRVVRQLTGLTPLRLTRSRPSPLATGFRRATGGGTVYL